MSETITERLVGRLDIRPGERLRTLLLFAYFFLITSPAYIIKPVRESLLLRFDPGRFAYADLLTAVLIGFVVSFNLTLLQRLRRRAYVTGILLFFVVSLAAFWLLFGKSSLALSLVYWFWSDVFIATTVALFWIAVSDSFHPFQAKRLIGLFVTGGLLGGIFGSLLSVGLVKTIGTRNLLLVCPALVVGAMAVANALYRHLETTGESRPAEPSNPTRVRYLEGFRILRRHRYLLLLAGTLACAMIVGKLIDYQFKTVGKFAFPDVNVRTHFLSTFNLGLLALSAVFHLFLTSRVLRRAGIGAALLVAPVLLILGAAAIVAVPAAALIVWAVGVRGADKSLDTTLSQSARELLYIPAPADVKFKAKLFIDMTVNKFSGGLGALLFLGLYTVLERRAGRLTINGAAVPDIRWVSVAVVVFALAWIGLGRLVARGYVQVVSGDLSRRWEDGESVVARHVDVDQARLVFDTLQSQDRSSTLYAMNLYDLARRGGVSPGVKSVLESRTGEVRARSMGALLDAGAESLSAGAEEILAAKDFDDEIREIMALDTYRKVVGDHIDKVLEDSRKREVDRMEAAKVLGLMDPTPATVRDLARLLQDSSAEVLYYALESAGRLARAEFVPLILRHLGNPSVGQVASDALAAYGARIVPALRTALLDPASDPAVRRSLPAVLGRLGDQAAADALIASLETGPSELEAESIAAAYRLKSENPGIVFPAAPVRTLVLRQIHKAYHAFLESEADSEGAEETPYPCAKTPGHIPASLRTVFDLLTLTHPAEEIVKAYQNLCQGTRRTVDYSLELLDNLLDPELKEYLFAVVEDRPAEEKARRLRRLMRPLQKAGGLKPVTR